MLAKATADYLVSVGLGTLGTDLFVDFLPNTVNALDTAIFTTGGFESTTVYDTVLTLQVRTRSANPQTAYDRCMAIYAALHDLTTTTLSDGTRVVSIRALQSQPNGIGRDAQDRQEYTQNYSLKVYRPSTHSE